MKYPQRFNQLLASRIFEMSNEELYTKLQQEFPGNYIIVTGEEYGATYLKPEFATEEDELIFRLRWS